MHRDQQGSIIAITNATGGVVEKRLFDPWGEVRKVQDGLGNNLTKLTFIDRGYTGHEHLQKVGLINMNARLYDPKLHRFLSPDDYIQDPYNTQNYNRYSYCWNNPTKHTDVSGNFIGIGLSIAIAATVAALTYTATALLADVPFTVSGLIQNVAVASLSAAVSFGIGEYAQGIGNFYARATFQALAHGTSQGFISTFTGGDFLNGFASGALSSIASSAFSGGSNYEYNSDGSIACSDKAFGGLGGDFAKKGFGTIAFGTVAGGAGSYLTGGNFWQGAVTGLVVSGFNHLNHVYQKHKFEKEIDNAFKDNADKNAPATEASVALVMKLPSIENWSNFNFELVVDSTMDFLRTTSGDAEAITELQTDNKSSKVTFYKDSFSSFRHLAHVVMHEIGHVVYNRLGFMANTLKLYDRKTAILGSERYAYTFAKAYGGIDPTYNLDYARSKGFTEGLPLKNFGDGKYIKY